MTKAWVIAWLGCLSLSVGLMGCASGTQGYEAGQATRPDEPVSTSVDELRERQMSLLYEYDTALGQGEAGCKRLCGHHTRICRLSTQICEISKRHPGHYKAGAACEKATETCRETTTRLPQDCWCRQ